MTIFVVRLFSDTNFPRRVFYPASNPQNRTGPRRCGPVVGLDVQRVAEGAQAGLLQAFGLGWMGVDRRSDVFQAGAHFDGE